MPVSPATSPTSLGTFLPFPSTKTEPSKGEGLPPTSGSSVKTLPGDYDGIQSRDGGQVIRGRGRSNRNRVIKGKESSMKRRFQGTRTGIYVSGMLGGSKEGITLDLVCRVGIVIQKTTRRPKMQFTMGKVSLGQVTQNEVDNGGKTFRSVMETMIQ
ncbi:hypothetical protein C8J55DRAFT_494206 [Lentinula edodes]|uniref:Uncharacterized protein n=1 Tax=Lentinula lateritia TaxID=40482 RepID=A0A9W8ZQZ8_9AGAR|nr:hypothetical protein C8J55DRAFT_494206 [Lentinula edodes]